MVSDLYDLLRLVVLHDAAEGISGNLAEFRCPFLSQLEQGQRVAKVKSGETVDVDLRFVC